MKNINQDELFQNVKQFLQGRGVDLKDGSYTRRLQQCCGLLTDVVNTTNKTVARACEEVDRKLKDIRETVRRRSGSKTGGSAATAETPTVEEPTVAGGAADTSQPKPKAKRARPAPAKAAPPTKRKSVRRPKGT